MGILHALVRLVALLWTLLITALIGNVIASNINGSSSGTKAINFTMFVAAWSWVAALYGLAAAIISALLLPLVMFPLDILAVLFTFINAIVLSAKLKAVNCNNIAYPSEGRAWIAYGSNNDEKRCREIQASTVFMWFLWVTFMACLFFTWKDGRGSLGGFGGRGRSSRPNMSQVGV